MSVAIVKRLWSASSNQPSGDLLALGQRQRQPRASPWWWPNATRRTDVREDRARALTKDPADRLEPFALLPSVPNLGALRRRAIAALPSLQHHTPPPSQKVKCCVDQLITVEARPVSGTKATDAL